MSESITDLRRAASGESSQGVALRLRDVTSSECNDLDNCIISSDKDWKSTFNLKDQEADHVDVPPLPWYSILIVIGVGFGFVCVASNCNTSLPHALTIASESSNEGRFIAERALHHLNQLVSSNARVSGSHENEVFAVAVLTREIDFIKQRALSTHNILVDVQQGTGCTFLGWKYGYTNCFSGITNIAVKLSAAERSETSESLLLSCHFDSAPKSPGASAGSQCAIMLELLHVLSLREEPLHNSVVFLFNGAKESYQQGALSFVTKHPWAKKVTAVINLDAFGVGGREMLFQQSMVHPWLLEMYAQSVPYPHGLVLMEEAFNVLLADTTDYNIFTEIGNIPGLGFATFTNGYVYRTAYDLPSKVSAESLQHTGDNMLALLKLVLSSDKFTGINEHPLSSQVYFDLFGLYMVTYSECTAVAVNLATVCLGVFVFTKQMKFLYNRYGDDVLRKHFRCCLIGNIICHMTGIIIAHSLARIDDLGNGAMSWYTFNWMVYPLFFVPVVICQMISALYIDRKRNAKFPLLAAAQISLLSQHLVVMVVLILGTIANVHSSYLPMLIVLFPSIAMYLMNFCYCNKSGKKWIIGFLIGLSLPLSVAVYHMVVLFGAMIPAYGRLMMPSEMPDVKIAGMSAIWCSLLTAHLSALVILVKEAVKVWCCFVSLRIFLFVVLTFTPLMQPYVMDPLVPTVQKIDVLHTERSFYNAIGGIRRLDSGYWVIPADQNSANSLVSLRSNLKRLTDVSDDCERHLYCAMPIYEVQNLGDVSNSFWVKAQAPVIHYPTSIELEYRKMFSLNVRRLKFVVKGPDHVVILASTPDHSKLIRWSLSSVVPEYDSDNRPLIIAHTTGMTEKPLRFSMDFKISDGNLTANSVNIVVVGHYMHSIQGNSQPFHKFLEQFPPWIHVTSWIATYKVWSF